VLKLIFAGTPEFARTALQALIAARFAMVAVLTQPDRPAGRGMKLQASKVKAEALAHGLPVLQPRSLRLDGKFPDDATAARAALAALAPDAIVVAAYGLILPPWALALPRLGCLNIHASLLPRGRGAAPIQRAIEAGDPSTGITIMQMDAGLDTGAMLLEEPLGIEPADTTASLHDRLARLGGRLIVEALERAAGGGLSPRPQPATGISYAHKIDKAEAAIDWHEPAEVIERRLRAFDPFPGATTVWGGEMVKCWRGEVVAGEGAPGEVLAAEADGIVVACGDSASRGSALTASVSRGSASTGNALKITEWQRAGGRRLDAGRFLQAAGAPTIGQRLGHPEPAAQPAR